MKLLFALVFAVVSTIALVWGKPSSPPFTELQKEDNWLETLLQM